MLTNPIYIGRIRHKSVSYDGQHEGIIPIELWDAVQGKLRSQSPTQRGAKKVSDATLLKGLLYDSEGGLYSPTFTMKKAKRYYYYISQNLLQHKNHPKGIVARLPAYEIEATVESTLRGKLTSSDEAIKILSLDPEIDHFAISHLMVCQQRIPTETLIQGCIRKVVVGADSLTLVINVQALRKILEKEIGRHFSAGAFEEIAKITIPFHTRRSYRGAVIIKPEKRNETGDDIFDRSPQELKNLVRGMIWRDEHFQGSTLRQIAQREDLPETYVGKLIRETFLLA